MNTMSKIILSAVMAFTLTIANAQSKKEQIENLTFSLDSLNQVVSGERQNLNTTLDSLDQLLTKNQQDFELEMDKSSIIIKNLNTQLIRLNSINDSINIQLITKDQKIDSLQNTSEFKIETEKWKKELLASGLVGKPCREDRDLQKWEEENPNAYWGLQEIQSRESDFNSDGIRDGLFYFPTVNCIGGNGWGSDFGMLVYSNDGQFLTNKNITQTIENRIKTELAKIDINSVLKIYINYKGLGKTIIGEYFAWTPGDANCCPRSTGTYEYSPTELTTEIKNKAE